MWNRPRARGLGRSGFAVLAVLAVALRVLVPPGFMAAPSAGGALPLVICTGHGPVLLDTEAHGVSGRAPGGAPAPGRPGRDGPCVFAAPGAAPLASVTQPPPSVRLVPLRAASIRRADLTPGRGLAAPPPPSQAPPLDL